MGLEADTKEKPVKNVEKSLRFLFETLKEDIGKLTEKDYEQLSKMFTGEVDDYIRNLLDKIVQKRKKRNQAPNPTES